MYFRESTHKYYKNNSENSPYISASAIAELYGNPFDEEYWSLYKAYEQLAAVRDHVNLLDPEKVKENFKKYKKGFASGDYELFEHLKYYLDPKEAKLVQDSFKEAWKIKNYNSIIKGSNYHKRREDQALVQSHVVNPWTNRELKVIKCNKQVDEDVKVRCVDLDNLEDGFYSELIVDHSILRGQIDKLYVQRPYFWTDDYKTNEKMNLSNPFQKMLNPISHLEDCNYNHYRLQLSAYNWILTKKGLTWAGTRLTHVEFIDPNKQLDVSSNKEKFKEEEVQKIVSSMEYKEKYYDLDYLEEEIENIIIDIMLNHELS